MGFHGVFLMLGGLLEISNSFDDAATASDDDMVIPTFLRRKK